MTHGSLFSGIGGFDLAAQWMGWENVFQVEIDGFCQKVLEKNFPNVKRYGDIKQFNGTEWAGKIDVLSGGFPCQPFSTAGRRKGKEDDRYLWPEMLRVIGEVQPSFIVGENVYGLVNWSEGLVFEEVQTSLESKGYEVAPVILPACGIDAPHRRDRIWFVAYSQNCYDRRAERKLRSENGRQDGELLPSLSSSGDGLCEQGIVANTDNCLHSNGLDNGGDRSTKAGSKGGNEREGKASHRQRVRDESSTSGQAITNNNNKGLQGSSDERGVREGWEESNEQFTGLLCTGWEDFPTQSPLCGGNDDVSNRVDSIKALGNAVVPKLVLEIFKAISSTMK